ncbi:hypothetical protein J6590_056553 [Homalodisca vitripennis]|nr:hypothetical protein J6590_056553 [Homalodisca vitripennis]
MPTRIPSIPVECVLLSHLTTSHTSETDTSLMNMLPSGLGVQAPQARMGVECWSPCPRLLLKNKY